MDPSFLMDWKVLLKENNEGKRGHPYRTPNAFITFLAKLRAMYVYHSDHWRVLQGYSPESPESVQCVIQAYSE